MDIIVRKEKNMEPNYTARKSIAANLSFWLILFFWLVIPLIIQIFKILAAKNDIIEFYDDKVVCKSGILNKREDQTRICRSLCRKP